MQNIEAESRGYTMQSIGYALTIYMQNPVLLSTLLTTLPCSSSTHLSSNPFRALLAASFTGFHTPIPFSKLFPSSAAPPTSPPSSPHPPPFLPPPPPPRVASLSIRPRNLKAALRDQNPTAIRNILMAVESLPEPLPVTFYNALLAACAKEGNAQVVLRRSTHPSAVYIYHPSFTSRHHLSFLPSVNAILTKKFTIIIDINIIIVIIIIDIIDIIVIIIVITIIIIKIIIVININIIINVNITFGIFIIIITIIIVIITVSATSFVVIAFKLADSLKNGPSHPQFHPYATNLHTHSTHLLTWHPFPARWHETCMS